MSSPAVVDSYVFVGSGDRKVYCLNASTGAHIWNYTTGNTVISSPAVADGMVYVGSWDEKVYCLNASTGAHIWNYTTGFGLMSSPAVADGLVFIGSVDMVYKVNALNASTGALVWSYTTAWEVTSPAVAGGMVFVGSELDYKVYALNEFTGAFIWSYTTGYIVWSSPAVADGLVFVGSYDNKVYALDASTGALVWSYTTGGDVSSSPAVADGLVFIGSHDRRVYAFGVIPPPVVMPLDIQVDVGSIHFRSEIAEFYVLTSLNGNATDSTITKATLYYSSGTTTTDLSGSITRIATGLYRIPYTIPTDAQEGTYTLVIEANYITKKIEARGTSFKSFQLSPTLTGWNAWLTQIRDGVATIQTDTTTIKTNLNTINATITEIQGNIATIQTEIGTIKTDVSVINAAIVDVRDDLFTINTTLGEVEVKLDTMSATLTGIEGSLATIETDIGIIKGTITSIQGDIATIETDIGTIKTILEEWTGGATSSIITPEGTFRILALTTSTLEGPIAFSDNVVTISLSGPSGTEGTTNIVIPMQLLVGVESSIDRIAVTIDDEQVVFTYREQSETYVLTVTYTHSAHAMKMYLAGLPPTVSWVPYVIATAIIVLAASALLAVYILKIRKPRVAKTK